MKTKIFILASLAICCTVGLVGGPVRIADGTEQATAVAGNTPVATAPVSVRKAGEAKIFDGVEFVYIPSGSFTMGSPSSEAGRESDETQHRVTISKGYWLSKYEVTQSEWESVMGDNPSEFKGSNNPVENVSFDDIQGYLAKKGTGYRLPTESEWEYACRGGSSMVFSFKGSASSLGSYAWHCGNSGKKTHPVGQKLPNPWGLYDMQNNVWEWCSDWYGDYPSGSVTDPTGSSSGQYRVIRGGSWHNPSRSSRSANRGNDIPEDRYNNSGFRLARIED